MRALRRRRPHKMTAAGILGWLEARGTLRNRAGMARYGITSQRAFGVSAATMRPLARRIGRDHALAGALWKTGWHEARILASLIEAPGEITRAQMEAWARDFDNWAVCDSVCYQLFDQTPFAGATIARWSRRKEEFVRRGAFAMLAGLAVHDKARDDEDFLRHLPRIERAANDDRNFVKKAVNWALRQIGKRNPRLNLAAIALAKRLATNERPAPRWIGRDALRELTSAAVQRRIRRRRAQDDR